MDELRLQREHLGWPSTQRAVLWVDCLHNMSKEQKERIELLQGTLDMLILRTLVFGAAHGHQIAKYIQQTSDELLQVEHGSLYPALHRLEKKGLISAKWEKAGKELKREYKYYRLSAAGRKRLASEESKWRQMTEAIGRILWQGEAES